MADTVPIRRRDAEKRGRRGEWAASLLLQLKGYRILGRRVRTHLGEIDLIAKSPRGLVCFVEVKARASMDAAIESIGPRQQSRIARAAMVWLSARPGLAKGGVRFDAITIAPRALPRHWPDAWRSGSG
jgi:putative endonuclease